VALGATLVRLSDPTVTPHDDFIASWAAGRLAATGANPYDPDAVLAVQRTAGWPKAIPYRTWYPPWTLPLLEPFGLLPYAAGRLLWYALQIAACGVSARLLWRHYGGDVRAGAASFVVAATFAPALVAIRTGQISPLLLLGVAGFLDLTRARRWVAAGACLTLVAIKPALLHVTWIAVLLWIVAERRWRVALGAAGATLALTAAALVSDPDAISQFLAMALHDAPAPRVSTAGMALRLAFAAQSGRDAAWLGLLPPLLGGAWLAIRWRGRAATWDWAEEMPLVLIASLVTTAYGWIYDDIVLLVPAMQIALATLAGRTRTAPSVVVGGWLAGNAAIAAMDVVRVDAFWYVWVPLAFAVWYATARVRAVPLGAAVARA
jgi:hypothetical protein